MSKVQVCGIPPKQRGPSWLTRIRRKKTIKKGEDRNRTLEETATAATAPTLNTSCDTLPILPETPERKHKHETNQTIENNESCHQSGDQNDAGSRKSQQALEEDIEDEIYPTLSPLTPEGRQLCLKVLKRRAQIAIDEQRRAQEENSTDGDTATLFSASDVFSTDQSHILSVARCDENVNVAHCDENEAVLLSELLDDESLFSDLTLIVRRDVDFGPLVNCGLRSMDPCTVLAKTLANVDDDDYSYDTSQSDYLRFINFSGDDIFVKQSEIKTTFSEITDSADIETICTEEDTNEVVTVVSFPKQENT